MDTQRVDIKLIRDALTGNYRKPNIFLCETDKTRICKLETTNTKASFKFNSYSEISFEVARVYNDMITGEVKLFPYYDKIEALRLIEVERLGFFEIQGPSVSGDGIKESKSITAYSLEYTLSQKYLEDLYNDGTVGSIEAGYIDEEYGGELPTGVEYPIITLYNPQEKRLSLLHLILEKAYGWNIGYIDESLKTKSRQFNIDRTSIYDFIMNDICEMFNCYAVFNTIENTINLYAEALTKRFECDGIKTEFTITPPYQKVGTVSDDGYKILIDGEKNTYNPSTGVLTLAKAPAAGHMLEVISEDLTQWETDVLVSFDNLSQEVNVDYNADDIKTVLTVEYGEGQNIREVNMGLPYITDLSYYYSVDWMGQELYDAYKKYNEACETIQEEYTNNVQRRLELASQLDYEENRVSLSYSMARNVTHETVTNTNNGEVYYVRTGDFPNYTYVEKTLPDEYKAGTTYFKVGSEDLTESKIVDLRQALGHYFHDDSMDELEKLVDAGTFGFTNHQDYKGLPFGDENYKNEENAKTLLHILNKHKSLGAFKPSDKEEDDRSPEDMYENMVVYGADAEERDEAIKQFLCDVFDQFGTNMLGVVKDMYVEAQEGFIAGWNAAKDAHKEEDEITPDEVGKEETSPDDDELTDEEIESIKKEIEDSAKDYPNYYPIILILEAIEKELGTSIHSEYSNPPASKSTGRYADYEKDGEIHPGIDTLTTQINKLIADNTKTTESLVMDTWFYNYYYQPLEDEYKKENNKNELTDEEKLSLHNKAKAASAALMLRLSPFLREDELVLDDIVSTELDTIGESLSIQEDALSAGYLELQKLSQPQLSFSMTMANIYALPEFAPIVRQFQLGNLIKVAIRPDYIKQSRLMQVDMGLDDFSDFSCEFGELTSLRTQSDIHADLLSQAASAGKQVATNSSYWTKGSDKATTTDLKIEQGLLDATTAIKSIDGTQDIVIDKYGIKLQKKNPETGEIDPKQARFVNNMLLFTDDGWKTSKAGLGEFTVDGETMYGLLAEAVIAGYIEGSKIKGSEIEGGVIRIGDLGNGKWIFEVKENGDVYMLGGDVKFTQGTNGEGGSNTISESLSIVAKDIEKQQEEINEIKNKQKYTIEIYADGPTAITSKEQTTRLTCKVYSWDADITNELDDSKFNWVRNSNNPDDDLIWNALPKAQGKKFIDIGVDDIYENASFSCEVDLLD